MYKNVSILPTGALRYSYAKMYMGWWLPAGRFMRLSVTAYGGERYHRRVLL
ncbi:hypothetical protein APHDU1_1526 [Anaplasma phagocytophilum]|nr:hypothetical protein APHDU1_1526 [Anaplasma phagocytophilum]